jgi:biuret amidohydrolase
MKGITTMVYAVENDKTALLLIDAQQEYFDPEQPLYTPNAETIRENLKELRNAADASGMKVVVVRHVHKADGSDVGRMGDFDPTPVFEEGTHGVEVIADLAPRETDTVIDKTRYSAFVNTRLHDVLVADGIDTIIVSGLMTNYCSVTTARHAHDLDYKVIFVSDANAGPDMPDLGFGEVPHAEVLKVECTSLAGGVADVATTAEVVAQMAAV